ncbi:hypothetical protein [Marinobacter sp. LV10MA510-1]|uniref:hypothetical protein n=1 Tax=Marinobacter sp. LV10MA510-1 TaxID=1415567 RepID=UPI000BF6D2DC|nr:hypothetical protein [Marinobacter sp. LV10MA510-1]PFG11787.1 hypothetical protein ATI45_4356 [Marinobacter sp. LV10MA510-1]
MTVYILAMAARQEVGLSGPLRLTPAREHLAVAVLVLLPRAQAIADKILARAAAIAKPVVVNFLGQGRAGQGKAVKPVSVAQPVWAMA